MALFNKVTKAAISPPVGKAAAASSNMSTGTSMIGQYYTYQEGNMFAQAMSVPTIARAQQLISSVISSMKLYQYTEMWNGAEMKEVPQPPRSWLSRIDKVNTNAHILSWTVSDLMMFGRAFWYITDRYASDGRPSKFTRLPAAMCVTRDQAGTPAGVWFAPSKEVYFNGGLINPDDLVQFLNGQPGIVYSSQKAISTSIKLEDARFRNASSAIPAGVLKQTGGEPLSGQELADLAAAFNVARSTNQTAALNEYLTYTETQTSPDKMLLIESANFQAMEMSRVTGVPAYLLNLSLNSYQYTNSPDARQDLWTYGCKQIAECIAQTLSGDNVMPAGTCIGWDIDDFIDGDLMDGGLIKETNVGQISVVSPAMPTPPPANGVNY